MSKRTYKGYIENDCHPVGYNEPCQSYYFGQTSLDLLLDKIDQLKQQLAEKDEYIEFLKLKNQKLEDYYCEQVFILDEDYNKDLEERLTEIKEIEKRQTQLAINELEKVEELILKIDNNHTEIKTLKNGYSTLYVDSPTVIYIIDQQIKELKGE